MQNSISSIMSRALRILAIGHPYIVAMNRSILRALAENPVFDITVAAPSYHHGDLRPLHIEPEPAFSKIRQVGIKAHLTRFPHIFSYDKAQLKSLASGGFDLVQAWEEPFVYAGYQVATYASEARARFCFRTDQNYLKHYPPPFSFFERKVLQRSQGWIAGGNLVYEAMLRRNYPSHSGRIMDAAVDLDAFHPASLAERSEVLTELGLSGPVIGFVGRLTKAKGLPMLIEALDRIAHKEWNLLIVGSGPYKSAIDEWISLRGLANRVRIMLVSHQQVPRYLRAMNMLVVPSQTTKNWREQFGRVIIEAFASGVPVIGSDSGEIPRVIAHAGKIVPESDVAAWSSAVTQLLDGDSLSARLSSLGLRRAQDFSVATLSEQYRSYYAWLADQPLNN